MALSARKRKALPKSAFVYPRERRYPIDTKKRARAALAYAARSDTFGSYSTVKKAVDRRYGKGTIGGAKKRKG